MKGVTVNVVPISCWVTVEFARAQEVQPLLQNMLNPFYGTPILLPNANALLITDSVSNL